MSTERERERETEREKCDGIISIADLSQRDKNATAGGFYLTLGLVVKFDQITGGGWWRGGGRRERKDCSFIACNSEEGLENIVI